MPKPLNNPLPESKVEINPVSPIELEAGVSNEVNFPTLNRVKAKITLSLD